MRLVKWVSVDLSNPPMAVWLLPLVLQIELSLREPHSLQPLVMACTVETAFMSATEPFAACRYPQYRTQLFGQFSESLIQASIERVSSQLSLRSLVP